MIVFPRLRMTDERPTEANERVTEEWKTDTSPGERVRTVMKRTYDPQPVATVAERALTTETLSARVTELRETVREFEDQTGAESPRAAAIADTEVDAAAITERQTARRNLKLGRAALDAGIGEATTATITVRWSVRDDYNVHYSDDTGRNLRWGVHPHEYTDPAGDGHYHPPPNASSDDDDTDASCIRVSELVLVARAVHQLWRTRYDNGSVDPLDDAISPP
jgi:hypothetical protein